MLARYAARVSAFVTFEDHVRMGGFGSAVIEALEDMNLSVPVIRIGWPDQFIEHGKIDQLRTRYGVTVEAALEQVLPLLARRRRPTLVAKLDSIHTSKFLYLINSRFVIPSERRESRDLRLLFCV